jgi:serine/threonine protein kinase
MWERKEYDGVKSDIFSLGVVLFNLVTGKNGFKTSKEKDPYYDLIRNVEDNDYTPYWNKVLPAINKVLPENFKKLYISMVAYNAENRPTIAEILNSDWLKEINILNKQQYELLENKIRKELEDLYQNIKEINGEKVTIADKLNENGYITRGITNNEEKFFKNSELKPKKIPNDRLNFNHYIKINGKLKVVEFMNSLADEIILKYQDNNYIEAPEENLKMNVIIDNDKSEENKGKKESKMDIELFEYEKGGYLLEFIRKGGEIPDYYKHFIEIKKIIINELLNINKV